MCGIAGIFNLNGDSVEREDVSGMIQAIVHRGPDEKGTYTEGNVGLGSCRLSIIDLKTGQQPIHNEDKTLWIVFNGEIYNFIQLKRDLLKKGHKFYTQSDTEVILHLYEELGEKCLTKLDGMFALAIWDSTQKELLLARDPMGKKPLYWASFERKFVFASEPKAILAFLGFKRAINKDSLPKYFFYGYVPSPETIFKNIRRLPAGSFFSISQKGVGEIKSFWELDYSQKINLSREEVKNKTEELLKMAVKKRLIADVPIGIFLSGGIDSSLVAAFVPDRRIEAFTIGFEDQKTDESAAAKDVAKHLGIKQNLKIFSDKEVTGILPQALELMDEPMADPSILPTYLVSSFAREKVKVVLSGDGGDENFAGYPKYLAHYLLEKTLLKNVPLHCPIGRPDGKFWSFLTYARFPLELRNQLWLSSLSLAEVKRLTGYEVCFEDIEGYHQIFNGNDPLDEALFLDQKMTLADQFLVKVDRASMANGLEVRCPFLDKKLVEFAAKIPFGIKIKNFRKKSILREMAEGVLPKKIINLPKKGFGIPLGKWLEYSLRPLLKEYLSAKKIKQEGVLDPRVVTQILKDENWSAIWKLLVFEIWFEKWLGK